MIQKYFSFTNKFCGVLNKNDIKGIFLKLINLYIEKVFLQYFKQKYTSLEV